MNSGLHSCSSARNEDATLKSQLLDSGDPGHSKRKRAATAATCSPQERRCHSDTNLIPKCKTKERSGSTLDGKMIQEKGALSGAHSKHSIKQYLKILQVTFEVATTCAIREQFEKEG
eukprot:6025661-Amphidinium_carterae.1